MVIADSVKTLQSHILSLCGKVIVGGYRDGFCLKLSPCLTVPAIPKTDPPPAKAISSCGSAGGKEGKKALCILQPEQGVRICDRNSPADTKVRAEGGGEDAPGTGAVSPAAHSEDHGEAAVHLQSV